MWENILIRDNFAFSPEIKTTAGYYALKHSIEFVIGDYVANGDIDRRYDFKRFQV
jgi:hypothetical protein